MLNSLLFRHRDDDKLTRNTLGFKITLGLALKTGSPPSGFATLDYPRAVQISTILSYLILPDLPLCWVIFAFKFCLNCWVKCSSAPSKSLL